MKKLLCIYLLFLFAACTGNKKEEKKATNAPPHIEKVNFFLEVSGSMAGYLNGSTDFVKTIPNLLVAIEHKVDSGRLKPGPVASSPAAARARPSPPKRL